MLQFLKKKKHVHFLYFAKIESAPFAEHIADSV